VVVGGASASATEIFTDALQREHRAVVIGRKTAGIVLLSRFYRLPDGGALQLSIEDYRTPTGLHLEGRGVEPDVSVSHTLADVRAGRDADLEAAVRELQRHSANPGS
jgi:carboxyl-terminal processing protease